MNEQESLREQYMRIFERLFLEGYFVNNVINKKTKYIFILESPHKNEILHGVPVAGISGISMSKSIFNKDCQEPLGKIIKSNTDEKNLISKIGLMNICQIPMQGLAYQSNVAIFNEFEEFFKVLEDVRDNKKKNSTLLEREAMEYVIIEKLKESLNNLPNDNYIIVPCGKTSLRFFNMAEVRKSNWEIIENIPHPSHNRWQQVKYKPLIQTLISKLI